MYNIKIDFLFNDCKKWTYLIDLYYDYCNTVIE